jgi:hypothetical protein
VTRLAARAIRTSIRRRTALALAVSLVSAVAGCSSGKPAPQVHRAAPSPTPKPTPSGPCQISATVTCEPGVLPVWTTDIVRTRLLGAKDVLPTMTHPYDPTWFGLTLHNQYMRRWANGNFVPGCHYEWLPLTGSKRIISGYNYLWSDYNSQYPHWPREGITQYAYVYTDPTVEAHDINTAWNQTCTTGHLPYRQLIGSYYSPPVKVTDQITLDVRSGWAHKRLVEKRYPDNSTTPEVDIFDYLQNGNVLIVDLTVEQYEQDPKLQYWDRTLSDASLMLDRQVAKLGSA